MLNPITERRHKRSAVFKQHALIKLLEFLHALLVRQSVEAGQRLTLLNCFRQPLRIEGAQESTSEIMERYFEGERTRKKLASRTVFHDHSRCLKGCPLRTL